MPITHRQVGFIEAKDNISRVGEGAFVRLKNGSIMLAYTEYYTPSPKDDAPARLCCIYSHDEGETWGDYRILLEKEDSDQNIMSVSFLRMPQGEILLFYLKKFVKDGNVICQPHVRRSIDEGETWSDAICCGPRDFYYVVNNDRVVRLRNGRILMPAALYAPPLMGKPLYPFASLCFIVSDDGGYTWYEQEKEFRFPEEYRFGPEEPGLYEHEDGTIWCYIRTRLGYQWQMLSHDGGDTWTLPRPNTFFSSPNSPMLVKKVCGLTVAVFNPIPNFTTRDKYLRGRTPLLMVVSKTDGRTHDQEAFPISVVLEDDPKNDFCYPAILEGENYFLLAYFDSNNSNTPLNSMKVVKIDVNEIE